MLISVQSLCGTVISTADALPENDPREIAATKTSQPDNLYIMMNLHQPVSHSAIVARNNQNPDESPLPEVLKPKYSGRWNTQGNAKMSAS
jgi:hypothetical protein